MLIALPLTLPCHLRPRRCRTLCPLPPPSRGRIQNDEPRLPSNISPLLRQLMLRLLRKAPDARPTTNALRQDEWVTIGGAEPMESPSDVRVDLSEDDVKVRPFTVAACGRSHRRTRPTWGCVWLGMPVDAVYCALPQSPLVPPRPHHLLC